MPEELTAKTAHEWLARHALPTEGLRFSELGGGISNKVVLAEGGKFRAVLKQSLGQLRTEVGWFSERERIFRESAAMRWLAARGIAGGHVPAILFEEPDTFTIAMEAAPGGAEMWKTRLFRGEHDADVARTAGATLGSMIALSWHNDDAARLFGDQTVFDQLRIDPYYRFTAERVPEVADYIDRLIEASSARRVGLVHGDWSPKNLLTWDCELWVIDWEVIHFGDPSFDVGFLLNHLLMKSIAMPQHKVALVGLAEAFLDGLRQHLPVRGAWISAAGLEHLPALLLARVDGKSPAEYLDATMRQRAKQLALGLIRCPAQSTEELFTR